jgi:MFS family permease
LATLLDVAGFSLMARLAPDEVLARVFGIFESLVAVSIGVGSVVTPLTVDALGARGALLALGSICPTLAILSWPRLRSLDRAMGIRDEELDLLQKVPMLRPLPVPVMDHLGRHLASMRVPAGRAVFEQGDAGDHFYVIATGQADVIGDGALIRTLGKGESFGEIALLRNIPRTTGVRARTKLELYALGRDVFVPAVSGYRPSAANAEALVGSLRTTFRPRGLAI